MRRARRSITLLATTALTAAGVALTFAPPAHAALGDVSISMSNNQVGASSTYTALFTTASAAITDLVVALPGTVSVPASPTVSVSTASSCTGSFSTAALGTVATSLGAGGNNIGIPLSGNIATIGTCVKIVVFGLTNPSSAGALQACLGAGTGLPAVVTSANLSSVTCSVSGLGGIAANPLTIVDDVAVALTFVTQVSNGVTNNLSVAPVLTMTVDNASNSFSITPAANGVTATSALTAVRVATNALTYSVQAVVADTSSVLKLNGDATKSIPLKFRASSTGSAPACDGSEQSLGANNTYASVDASITGLTNLTTTNVRYCWTVDLTKPAGSYTATITYLAVPSF